MVLQSHVMLYKFSLLSNVAQWKPKSFITPVLNYFRASNGAWGWTNQLKLKHPNSGRFTTLATLKNHYEVLGVSSQASFYDIKRAYRRLAKKYNPDVNKDSRAGEVFTRIGLAYDVLSNEATRNQYDQSLRPQEDTGRPLTGDWDHSIRWKTPRGKNYKLYYARDERACKELHDMFENEILESTGNNFLEVLVSALVTEFMAETVGTQLALTFSVLAAFFDRNLDSGYKIAFLLAWILGGTAGFQLTLFLYFGIWVSGKERSDIVVVIVLAMMLGSTIARYAPLPQGESVQSISDEEDDSSNIKD